MNKWECEKQRCPAIAIGVGGARGLRAVGWFVSHRLGGGPLLLCPAHHPDGLRHAEEQAHRHQGDIEQGQEYIERDQ